MNIEGKKVTIVGAGKSGIAAAKMLKTLNATVRISDKYPVDTVPIEIKTWIEKNADKSEFGGHSEEFICESDLLVVSPGVRFDSEPIQWASAKGIPVIGEIEFAFRHCTTPIIAVTGSNGKTTVATLITEVVNRAGKKACLCGNVGDPFALYALDGEKFDYIVLEVSSFQLETIDTFKPYVAILLNCTENHLDRHSSFEEYFDLKARIFENQKEGDFALLNASDKKVKELGGKLKSKVRYFNSPDKSGGSGNPNYDAVKEVAQVLGIDENICKDVFDGFKGVEHRLEYIRTLADVDYVNDSKSTTAEATRWALERAKKPIVMIAGGRDKNLDFSVLRDLVSRKVKMMVVIGEAKKKLKDAFGDVVSVIECDNLKDAVETARKNSEPGDCVILSPMCASFDMFTNFEERGKVFKEIVTSLI